MPNDGPLRVSGVILAGGQSRRMGRDKAFLELNGKPLIVRAIERAAQVCTEVTIVANEISVYEAFGMRVIHDVYPGKGSLGGLYSGLLNAREEYVLALACDMPFVNQELLRHMISLAPQYDVVIPHAHDPSAKSRQSMIPRVRHPLFAKQMDLHPMHAIYSKRCLPIINERLQADDLRLIGILDHLQTRFVEAGEIDRFDPEHLSFFNVNNPENYEFAQAFEKAKEKL